MWKCAKCITRNKRVAYTYINMTSTIDSHRVCSKCALKQTNEKKTQICNSRPCRFVSEHVDWVPVHSPGLFHRYVLCVCVCFCFRAAYLAKIFFRGDVCTVAAAAATKRCYSISSLVQEIAFCERKFASDFLIHLPIACSLWQLFSLLFFLFANALDWSHLSAFKQHLFAI